MDWIHCNGCYVQPGSKSPQFFLTTCGHIFCEGCNTPGDSCRVCNSEYTTTLLSGQLRDDVREFFMADPISLLNKFIKVLQYQKDHRDRFIAHLRRTQAKYDAAKREIQRIHEEMKQNRKKIHAQQQEIAWYKMQRDRARARAASAPRTSPATVSPFGPTPDSQRSALLQMRGSGMGDSRLTMTFTGAPQASREPISPFSIPSTPVNSRSAYRSNRAFLSTPDSTASRGSLFPSPASPILASSDRGYSQSRVQPNELQSPPSRGTPTDALQILSLAYKTKNGRQ